MMRFILAALFFFGSFGLQAQSFPSDGQCVLIYYDQTQDPDYNFGEVYSVYLQNLMGHFPEVTQVISPIARYKKGEIEKCRATIYLGSYFENAIPTSFFEDFKNTEKNVAWLGYNIWKFAPDDLEDMFGHTYTGLTKLDTENRNAQGDPSFFKYVDYKGERFDKFAQWVERDNEQVFAAPFEQTILEKSEEDHPVEVLATSIQDESGEEIPYALRSGNKFYVADIPFSYVHESDRYLVFSDLLFDILDLPPRHQSRKAVMRIEDVHPLTPVYHLMLIEEVFKTQEVPLHIALIPMFYDPLYNYDRRPGESIVPMNVRAPFMNWIKRIQKDNAVFIWHGVTHQYKSQRNPHSGYSSDDFEFWDAVNNTTIKEDSVNYVLDRLDLGMSYLKEAGISPKVWLTPHYQASALDYYIFADVFDWNIGRAIYFLNEMTGVNPQAKLPAEFRYDQKTPGAQKARRQHFESLNVDVEGGWFGQLYPYEIYGDVYGQRLIPEILGNPQPFTSDHVWYPRSLDDILADAKRNKVIRDSWASLFFHPYILTDLFNGGVGDYPGDKGPLIRLIKQIKSLGYEFVSLDEFAEQKKEVKNVTRIKINLNGSMEYKK
jgi:uncharacterized protein YdaL